MYVYLQVAERLCVDSGAVQSIVAAAGTHRASKDMREAVAGCLEQLLASNSAECQMYVAHFAAPVCGCGCVRDRDTKGRAGREGGGERAGRLCVCVCV